MVMSKNTTGFEEFAVPVFAILKRPVSILVPRASILLIPAADQKDRSSGNENDQLEPSPSRYTEIYLIVLG